MARGLAALGAVLLLAGCSSAAANADGDRTVTDEVGGQQVRVDLPTTGDAKAVAVWFHGQGGDVDTRMNEDWLNTLRGHGWAVASSDFHGNAWGNQASVETAADLVSWAEEQAGADVRLLVAGSMGALASLNALADGDVDAACWFGTMPVVDLNHIDAVPEAEDQVKDAYDGAPPASSNPAARLSELPASTRYFVVSSPDDTWVPAAQHADVLVAGLQAAGAPVDVAQASGEHGDASHFRSDDLGKFAAGCLPR